ncbi:MAG: type II toxin-antitoxin system Phd/YefM family antitoxin [Sulfuricurvum sp.]|nr:type II toxin-antitoxin system Phd/YefM family antitoxin [Sulfuricurvum sp.]MDD2782347.1 type II toxin-antitoxin system Phd/YefM family antitoxin [Sulfuricurvum sp.]
MIAYSRDEIIPATEVARNFSSVFKSLVDGAKEKIAIAKNNKLELVVLPIEEYERLKEIADLAEHIEIYKTITDRTAKDTGVRIGMSDMMNRFGVNEADVHN